MPFVSLIPPEVGLSSLPVVVVIVAVVIVRRSRAVTDGLGVVGAGTWCLVCVSSKAAFTAAGMRTKTGCGKSPNP